MGNGEWKCRCLFRGVGDYANPENAGRQLNREFKVYIQRDGQDGREWEFLSNWSISLSKTHQSIFRNFVANQRLRGRDARATEKSAINPQNGHVILSNAIALGAS